MALVLPYPNTPLNGQPGDPVPINANFTAIAQAIQSFDGSQISTGTVVASALNSTINPITRDNLLTFDFVSSGCVWSTVSGFSGTMSVGTLFINGNMAVVNGVISKTFTASKDTYIDIDVNGSVYYQEVSNNASSPSITANSIRIAIIVTSGAAITSINQGSVAAVAPVVSSVTLTVTDTLGNLIYPTDPMSRVIGYRQITSNFSSGTNPIDVTGLSMAVIVPASRKVRLSGFSRSPNSSGGAGTDMFTFLNEGATILQEARHVQYTTNASQSHSPSVLLTPTAGVHTYKMVIQDSATGTKNIDANASYPAYIMAELA